MTTDQTSLRRAPLRFDFSAAERDKAVKLTQRLVQRRLLAGPVWAYALRCVAILMLIFTVSFLGERFMSSAAVTASVMAIGLLGGWLLVAGQRRRARALVRERIGDWLGVAFDDDGLYVESAYGQSSYGWYAVMRAEVVDAFVLIHLRGSMQVPIPLRVFDASGVDAATFVDDVNARARAPTAGDAAMATEQIEPASAPTTSIAANASFLRALGGNLVAGVQLAAFRSRGLAPLHATAGQLFALVVVATAITLIIDVAELGLGGRFELAGLRGPLVLFVMAIATAWIAATLARAPATVLRVAVALAAVNVVFVMLNHLRELDTENRWLGPWSAYWLHWGLMLWFVFAGAVAAARATGAGRALRSGVGLAVALSTATLTWLIGGSTSLWTERFDATAARGETQQESATSEAVVYRQPELLDQALAAIEPERKGRVDLYYIGLAGAGYQDVFVNEVEGVEKLLHQHFDARGRGILLANAARTPLARPFASTTALERALTAIAGRINVDEDVLFLFMTSHGSSKHEFQIEMWPYRFDPITPARLRVLLDASGIKHRAIVVSACYAGGFVQPLATADTLIVTAARADRASFGCKDGEAWTYFGEAYFAHGLATTGSFERAFEAAVPLVAERELREKREPSEPQISVGERIRERLRLIENAAPSPQRP